MKGTILDFLKLAAEDSELAKELTQLATKHGFEFSDEVSDEDLDNVAGGVMGDRLEASLPREQSMAQTLAEYSALQERIYAQILGGSKG